MSNNTDGASNGAKVANIIVVAGMIVSLIVTSAIMLV